MEEMRITGEDYKLGYKVCPTCHGNVHMLKEDCECKREICKSCGYSVVNKEVFEEAQCSAS